MAKQTKENAMSRNDTSLDELSETLLALDMEKQTLQAVSGIDKDGKLKTVDPKNRNSANFIKIDRHGDFFSNFYANFLRQLKDPTRFRFFKVPIPRMEFLAGMIRNNLQSPTQEGEALIKQYEVKSDKQDLKENIEKKQNTGSTPDNTNQSKQDKTMETPTTASEFRYQVEDIDWNTLNKMGITQEKLQKMNVMDDLLKGYKTNQLVSINLNLGSVIARTDARLSLQPGEDGKLMVAIHGLRKEPTLQFPFFGHTFTDEDKKNLLAIGNMGRIVPLENQKTGEIIPSIISIDRLTNELVALRADKIKIPEEIKGVKLSEEQKNTLLEGKPLYLEGMISNKGKEFSANIQFNADKRYVEFLFDRQEFKKNRQVQENGEVPHVIRGKELNEEQYNKFKSGQTIYVDDLIDKQGKTYKGYLTFKPETGKTSFSFGNPNKQKAEAKQTAQPDEKHKTQVAVNSQGKTNEATKHLKEPLQKGQTNPTENQQEQKEQKSRGRKM